MARKSTLSLWSSHGIRPGSVLDVGGEHVLVRRVTGNYPSTLTVVRASWWRVWPRKALWAVKRLPHRRRQLLVGE
jgi:hypothetical protein